MLRNSLVEILRTFSKEEISEFEDFVKSPFHNKKSNVIKLFAAIKKCGNLFDSENLEKEKLWEKIFPGKTYNYGVMKNLIHDLTKLAEEYIVASTNQNDALRNNSDLIRALSERNLSKLLTSKIASFEKKYNEENYRASNSDAINYYAFLGDLYSMKAYTLTLTAPDKNTEQDLILASEFALYSGVLSIMKSIPNYISFKLGGAKYERVNLVIELFKAMDIRSAEAFLLSVNRKSPSAYVLIRSFYLFCRTVLSETDTNDYFKMKKFIFSSADLFSGQDLKTMVNCITVGLAQTKAKYSKEINVDKEILDLYDFNIERGSLTEDNGTLRDAIFIKYITHCCSLKNIKKAEDFLSVFSNLLKAETRENSVNAAKAHISFAKKDYHDAQNFISKVQLTYFELKITVKSLQAMIFFELDEYESFIYLYDSLLHFSRSNKRTLPQKMHNFKLFGDIVKDLFRIKLLIAGKEEAEAGVQLSRLKAEIQHLYPLRKTWLLEKIEYMQLIIA